MRGEKLAQALEEDGITFEGLDVLNNAKEAKLIAPEKLEIRFPKGTNEDPFLSRLAETVKKFTGEEPNLVGITHPNDIDPGTYEIWFSKR